MTTGSKFSRTIGKKNDGLGNNQSRQKAQQDILALAQDVIKLQQAHNALAQVAQKELNNIGDRLDDIAVICQALATVVGIEKVNDVAKNIRIEMSEKDVAAQEANVAKALTEGKIKAVDAVTENCLLVTTIVRADGSQVYPRKSFVAFGSLKPEIQAIAKDKKVGDKFELPTGAGIMTVLEIYEDVPEQASGQDEEKSPE